MPTYEYRCPKCGTEFEAFQKMSDKPVAKCPKCGAKAERLLSGGAGLVFKGSGFYLTDYGRAGQKAKAEKEGGEKAAADKPAGDTKPAPAKPASTKKKKDD